MKNYSALILLFFTFIFNSCSDDDIDLIDSMWVNSEKIEVDQWFGTGVCYSTQENITLNEDNWTPLCQGIEGFDEIYEEGYIYKISVNKIKIKNPPQDASSVKYKLKDIISKELDE